MFQEGRADLPQLLVVDCRAVEFVEVDILEVDTLVVVDILVAVDILVVVDILELLEE